MRGVPRERLAISSAPVFVDFDAENFGRALDNDLHSSSCRIKLKPQHDAEARAQRRRKQSCACGGANERERLHVHGVRAGRRGLARS